MFERQQEAVEPARHDAQRLNRAANVALVPWRDKRKVNVALWHEAGAVALERQSEFSELAGNFGFNLEPCEEASGGRLGYGYTD
jgi:hypothetical protein